MFISFCFQLKKWNITLSEKSAWNITSRVLSHFRTCWALEQCGHGAGVAYVTAAPARCWLALQFICWLLLPLLAPQLSGHPQINVSAPEWILGSSKGYYKWRNWAPVAEGSCSNSQSLWQEPVLWPQSSHYSSQPSQVQNSHSCSNTLAPSSIPNLSWSMFKKMFSSAYVNL